MPHDCFLSHASADLALAEAIHARLTAASLSVWFDKRELNFGDQWHNYIAAACESSRVLLPLLTPRWRLSEWTRYETYGAETIIPLLLEGDFAQAPPPPLTRWEGSAVSLDPANSTDPAWDKLSAAIRAACARPLPARAERVTNISHAPSPVFVGRGQTAYR